MIVQQEVEARTRQLGREMFERMRAGRPWVVQPEWWHERMMRMLMTDERLRVQAFRFIDVLPTLSSPRDVARHLQEYFSLENGEPHGRRTGYPTAHANGHGHNGHAESAEAALAELEPYAGGLARLAAGATRFDDLDSAKARFMAWLAWKSATSMAYRFIAGSTIREAESAIRRMRDRTMAFTIDVLGEAALSEAESEHYHGIYMQLIRELPEQAAAWPTAAQIDTADGVPLPRVNVSVKLSSLHSQFDAIDWTATKRIVIDRLRPLLREGMRTGSHIHIDMEHYAFKELTLDICREIFSEPEFRDYPHFGIVLQAYLKECERDAAEIVRWAKRRGAPIWIRLVKGAYWDTETVLAAQQHWPCPVWEQKWQSDATYERLTRMLLENWRIVHTAFGSHNVRSLAHAMAVREALGVPGWAFELQMLYGMGDPIKRAAVEMGQRCRIYTPYGELLPGMAYLIRRLLENTANESFLRHTGGGDVDQDELLRNPEEVGRETPPHEAPMVIRYEFEDPAMPDFDNVPNTDFIHESNRQQMGAAIDQVRATFGREYPLVIGRDRVRTGQWHESLNPSRPAEVVGRVAYADKAAAERAADIAASAFTTWRWTDPIERAEYLYAAAEIMKQRRFELAALEALECGKPWREADADVSESIDFCNYYAREMIRMAENIRRRDIPGETNEYYYAPRGVVAVISPWNFPLAILTGMATAALVTGNTVIMKPAAPATVTAAMLMEIFEQAGLPEGVLNYLPGPGSLVGEVLVKDPRIAMIAFTGSRDVGTRINRVAAESLTAQPSLKKVIAEMGGKNGVIIDSDADLDEAIKGTVYSAFGYAGQKCSACSRAIVLEDAHDRFVERLVEAARSVSVGPADEPGTFVPPVIDKNAFENVRRYVETGKSEARCVLEVDTTELIARTGGGYYIGPTIFDDVAADARIAREEIFGPVLAIITARDMDHAIQIFNNTDYALTGGIYSRSPANIERARRECECGNFYINRRISGALVDVQPFGGFKMSGIGSKAGGPDYLIQFCEPRCVTENTLRRGFAPSDEVVGVLGGT